jgi:hypothetical protein
MSKKGSFGSFGVDPLIETGKIVTDYVWLLSSLRVWRGRGLAGTDGKYTPLRQFKAVK